MTPKSRYILFILAHTHVNKNEDRKRSLNMTFVHTLEEIRQNFAVRFSSHAWLETIDFLKRAIIGECVLSALCQSPFPDAKQQDINLIYYVDDILYFKESIDLTVDNLSKIV